MAPHCAISLGPFFFVPLSIRLVFFSVNVFVPPRALGSLIWQELEAGQVSSDQIILPC
jgi:hypothetical protein